MKALTFIALALFGVAALAGVLLDPAAGSAVLLAGLNAAVEPDAINRELKRISAEVTEWTKNTEGEIRGRFREMEMAVAELRQSGSGILTQGGGLSIGTRAVTALHENETFQRAAEGARRGMKAGAFNARVDLDGTIRAALTGGGGGSSELSIPSMTDPRRVVGPAQRPLRLLDVLPARPVQTDSVEFIQLQVVNGAFAEQEVQGDPKAELQFDGDPIRADIVTVAGWMAASKQVLSDQPALGQVIDGVLRHKGLARLEHQIINGPGGQGRINGLLAQATTLVPTIANSAADVVGEALVRMANMGYLPNLVLLNPMDWFRIQITKEHDDGTSGQYVFGSPTMPVPPALWNAAIVATPSVPEGSGLTIDTSFVTVLDREQLSVSVTNSHADYFVRNLVAVLCELRAGLEVLDTWAVCKFDVHPSTEYPPTP